MNKPCCSENKSISLLEKRVIDLGLSYILNNNILILSLNNKSVNIDLTDLVTFSEESDIPYLHSQITGGANPHNTTFANLASKPITVSGFGITDAYTKAEIDAFTFNFVTYYNSI